jgi:hypothetical protein
MVTLPPLLLVSDFDRVPHSLLLRKLSAYWLSDVYVSWLHSYTTNRFPFVGIYGIYSIPLEVLSGVPQGSVLGSLLFNVFINDLCNYIKHARYLLFSNDLNIFRTVTFFTDCALLHSDTDYIYGWCSTKSVMLNSDETRVISFTRQTNPINYNYKLSDTYIRVPTALKV